VLALKSLALNYLSVEPTRKPRGRPRKTHLDLPLKLNEKQHYWLEYLREQGFRGNDVKDVAVRLLDEKLRELYENKALPDAFIEPVRGDNLPNRDSTAKSKSGEELHHE
jgi:hypothetical protein